MCNRTSMIDSILVEIGGSYNLSMLVFMCADFFSLAASLSAPSLRANHGFIVRRPITVLLVVADAITMNATSACQVGRAPGQ